ncbi:MAG TPA: trypsin-like peptidase domain-containing protein [Candidatus Paceibacterota bacterium]|nr:trypsin-like peptidase domain-containing protein [Candidatus Paceibacterota bacterium]
MPSYFSKCRTLLGIVGLMALGLVAFGAYQYIENQQVLSRLASVESQIAAIAAALQESGVVSEKNRLQLQEIAKRGGVITRSQEDLLTSAVEKSVPAVVSIVISRDIALLEVQYVNPFGDDPYFRDIGYRVPVFRQVGTRPQQIGAGTGFLIRSDGYILTNRHVVDDEQAEYTALLSSGEKKTAKVVYRDKKYDIAVLKIDGNGYPTIPLGNSSDLRLGQTVAAIGNALGEYNNSVSVGIISGMNRTIEAQDVRGRVEVLENVIQTDAAINRGNSGGPLLDLAGNAIGVNVAVDRGGSNIAFAIPIDTVKSIINQIVQ